MTERDIQRFTQGAVALSLSVHKLGNRQHLEDEEYEASGASKDMTSASRKLFAKCEELNAIHTHLTKTKRWVEARSLPTLMRGGLFFVKSEAVVDIDDYLRQREEELGPLVEAFVAVMDERIEQAKAKLKGLAINAKWPTEKKVRRRYAIKWNWMAFETPETLKGLNKAMYDRELEKAQLVVQEARDNAVSLLSVQLEKLVDHMVERLQPGDDGKAKVFKSASVDNLNEFLATFDMRNLGDSKELEAAVAKSRALLQGVDATLIRKEEGVRNAVAGGFVKVKKELEKLVTDRPKRAIDFDDED